MIYGSWNISCDRQNFSSFWAIFCPFSPLTTWKIKILTLKKTPRDIIILHICNINDNHMMYGSWDMGCDRHNFLSFWTIFCPFTPDNPKNHNFEKMKKTPRDTITLHMCTIYDNMMHGSWYKERDRHNFLSFWTIFCPFTPLTTQKIKILKNWKKSLEILSFYTSAPKIMIIYAMLFLGYGM